MKKRRWSESEMQLTKRYYRVENANTVSLAEKLRFDAMGIMFSYRAVKTIVRVEQ